MFHCTRSRSSIAESLSDVKPMVNSRPVLDVNGAMRGGLLTSGGSCPASSPRRSLTCWRAR